ncbi:MAG: OmpA family protein [Alphaproteobacteria bacterium]|nr:OmpA family protein [Alphaproteobacteria bacterium]
MWGWIGLALAGPNVLTLGEGAVVVRAAEPAEKFAWVALDGSDQTLGVGIPRREPLPLAFVVELPALTTIERFEVPAFEASGAAAGRHVKTLRIEGSTKSPDDGFEPLVVAVIEDAKAKSPQSFAVAKPRAVRWVRVTAEDRQTAPKADHDPHNFAELLAFGTQEPIVVGEKDFTGRWRLRRKGLNDEPGDNTLELFQDGSLLRGCAVRGGQVLMLSGAIEHGLARLVETNDLGQSKAFTARVTADGQLAGVRFGGPATPFWMAADPDAATPCSEKPAENPVQTTLQNGQVAVLHGIHFDVDSDVLRADAKPALEQLLAALQAVPALSVTIEGHTDSDGSDAHNLDLSARRAASVVKWLTDRGIEAKRLKPVGKGETEPIADNATSAGRALNRRVQVLP